ncbi:MAG: hypothetical protein Q9220_006288 [cf. Caloplaca sp. 1 TL-2023]
MARPLPDHTAWQITPTLHSTVNSTTDPSTVTLPQPCAVCIFGASRGIGAHTAYSYAKAGASSIILVGRDTSALAAAVDEARRSARREIQIAPAICDITSDTSIASLAQKIKDEVGRLDILVVNAALWGETATRVTEGSTKLFQDVVNTDIMGAYLAAHHLLPIILASEGEAAKALIAIGGTGAWVTSGPVAHTAHCMSKLAQARMMELVANDFEKEELLVLTVHPGCVWTDTSSGAPEMFHQYLTDDPGLCGGFLVWLTKTRENRRWMNGRFLSATWDADELLSMKDAIVEGDMLKARMVVT